MLNQLCTLPKLSSVRLESFALSRCAVSMCTHPMSAEVSRFVIVRRLEQLLSFAAGYVQEKWVRRCLLPKMDATKDVRAISAFQ